jgi:hypothetical protein
MAAQGAAAGAAFALLDDAPVALDPAKLSESEGTVIGAIGLADPEPVYTTLINPGLTRRPLTPVHGRAIEKPDGSFALEWCRRSRGSWAWLDGVEVPLSEQTETYLVGLGDSEAPELRWETGVALLEIDAADWSSIRSVHAGKPLWVRQVGTTAASLPLLLTII